MQLGGVFLLTLATTGISVGFNFLGRDFYNVLANKDQEQFMKQLLYYLGAFAGGIPIFVLRNYARETLSLRWRSWMERYYIVRYLSNQAFYRIQSQSIIDNPDQRIVDDLSSFTGTALSFSLTLFNAVIDLISFSNILFGIYPPLFVVLLVYLIGGTVISVFIGRGLVTLNFLQEKKEADFGYGLVHVRENAESIAFYSGEDNEMQILLQRFKSAFENLTDQEQFMKQLLYCLGAFAGGIPYYMKTGECKYGAQCRFHHPIDRPAVALSTTKPSQQENVKLTLAGLPRRELEMGGVIYVYYLKTGACKYGATCRFDHPPSGEVVAMAASLGKSDSTGGKA